MKTEYQLEYEVFENKVINNETKPQIWFAFHGIGQNTEAFQDFANQNNFKVYSFGLFYHEKNKDNFQDRRETSLSDWLILMKNFLEKEYINLQDDAIHVIGFSLGVRPALQFVSNFSQLTPNSISINEIILIAPETLAINRWYRFGTQTIAGKFILQKLASSTKVKETILSISSLLFSKTAQKLIRYQVYTNITSLAGAWQGYRSFEIYGKNWKEITKNQKGKITIVASENDGFVELKRIQKFVRRHSADKGDSIQWIISKSPHGRLLREFKL
ncbi:MAG: hypothetical protein COZ18_02300 [Flexibacter sp. CG_4_10_14_3_um_filter_32_15]|nr:MAG: hypothetical protein COZ18_02300 [Flexibacter sp. CG_4_10_14_3_um_filter_32_15]